ncbi:YscO family type III secretion system apparatus protein [Caenimonas sp. SL110]|uniref:type III secretion system stalk subunit SctO n=1 Tax=Caenimonas sp. SL110 TaxID=1450524 RepID=UPI000652FD4F|nr:YscO family type III secretion system apparatus protein [Caenimonas sp. SL110]
MDVINGLLRIKRIRQDCRESDMWRSKQQFEHAAELLKQARDLQQQRDLERVERERSLYKDVCERIVVVRDLDELRYEVDTMKEAAKVDEQSVQDAQTQRLKRREAFDEATAAWRFAARATQKFMDLSEHQRQEAEIQAERLAELELEEFPGKRSLAMALEESTEEA